MFDAVIFDLDGTLLDTLADIGNAANDVLLEMGEPTHPLDSYRTMVGDGVSTLFLRALPRCNSDPSLHQKCILAFERHYATRWNQSTAPYAGIADLLDWLVEHATPIAVLSNKPQAFTQKCVDEFLPRWRFEIVLGASDRFPKKPDPASARFVIEQLQTTPRKTLYVGDTNTDMWTAKGAGCWPVGVTWGFRSRAELIESGAQTIIDHPSDLKTLFG
jgi:phosphoglycolate phosphatase